MLVFIFILIFVESSAYSSNIEKLPRTALVKQGDLQLGALVYHQGYSPVQPCADTIGYLPLHQMTHAIVYNIDNYNKRSDILPNITLGITLLDECFRDIPAIPRFIQLLPVLNDSADPRTSLSFGEHYKVLGTIGPVSSTPNVIMATMSGFFQIPQISSAPIDELSDKIRFPYYFRTIPPDRFQSLAIIKFAKALGWEYLSLVYVQAGLGFNANRYLHAWAKQEGICIEETYAVAYESKDADYEAIVKRILLKKAKVVGVFAFGIMLAGLMRANIKLKVGGRIIWFIPESIPLDMMLPYIGAMEGNLYVQFNDVYEPGFYDYYEQINPWNTPDDPWLKMIWKEFYNCDATISNCGGKYPNITAIPQYWHSPLSARPAEAVHAYAHAMHALIKERCPEAFVNKELLKDCVKPEIIRDYLRNVDVQSSSGRINFDESHDNLRPYIITQIRRTGVGQMTPVRVGSYDVINDKMEVEIDKLEWKQDTEYNEQGNPESVCSHPCEIGEMYIQGDVPCCWTCRRCRDNEIVSSDRTKCIICPEFTWPDSSTNYTSCQDITLTYLTWDHPYAIGLSALAGAGTIGGLVLVILIIKHRNRRVIKASSRELITVIMVGILMAFITIPCFINKPTYLWCNLSRLGFTMSGTLIFAPLFVKSVRIYRIFAASEKFKTSVRASGMAMQLLLVSIVTAVQIIALIATYIPWTPNAIQTMPIRTEKLVELHCDLNMYGTLIPLSYNILLTILCAFLGFMTRKLPDNFNESWYIFICVCTNLFIWVAFMPTYFSAFYAYHKALLLAFAMLLNGAIPLVCLFGPKIYAVYYVDEKDIKVTDFKGRKARGPFQAQQSTPTSDTKDDMQRSNENIT